LSGTTEAAGRPLVLRGGLVRTLDPSLPVAEAVVVRGPRIAEEIDPLAGRDPAERLAQARVRATMLAGRWIHGAER